MMKLPSAFARQLCACVAPVAIVACGPPRSSVARNASGFRIDVTDTMPVRESQSLGALVGFRLNNATDSSLTIESCDGVAWVTLEKWNGSWTYETGMPCHGYVSVVALGPGQGYESKLRIRQPGRFRIVARTHLPAGSPAGEALVAVSPGILVR